MSPTRVYAARTAVIALVALAMIVIAAPLLLGDFRPGSTLAAPTPGAAVGITVHGIGRVTLTPDTAGLSVGVMSQAASAAKAQADASAAMTRIIAALKKLGIADKDLVTQVVGLSPNYVYPPGGGNPTITGYVANQNLAVKVRQIDQTGPVIDAAVAAGANTVGGISFSVANPAAATDQARQAAVADARTRAQTLAKAANVTLGAAIAITETSSPETPIPYAADKSAGSATPIQVGTTDVVVDVEVTFAID